MREKTSIKSLLVLKKGGIMKKLALLSMFVLCLNVHAYDTAGKFGMGVRFWGTPLITFTNIKYGLNNNIDLEPSFGYYRVGYDYEYYTASSNLFFVSLLTNIKPIRTKRSNLLIKLGGLYARNSTSYDTYSYGTNGLALLFGLGIEHFVNDNFSVNVGALSGYWHTSPDDSDASFSFTGIGNQLVDFSLVWHLE
jgi:hypothetical protein